MYLQFLFSAAGALELSENGFLIAVAVFACLLGAEIAGIVVLISKLLRGRGEKQEIDRLERSSDDYYHYGFPMLALGAIPQATYTALSIIAGLAAVAAVVFAILLIVARKNGYLFISSKDLSALAEAERNPKPVEEPVVLADQTEEPQGEAYAESEAETAFTVFEEAYEEAFEEAPAACEEPEEALAEVAACEEAANAPAAMGDPVFADGSQPYKIVEKIVTETQKEIVREVPVQTTSGAAEQLMEKLTDFLDYELQKRKDADTVGTETDGAVAVLAQNENDREDAEDDEDEDEQETDTELDADEEDDLDFEEPDSEDRFTGNERIVGFDDVTGCYLVAHYRKSFEAKLIQARPRIKEYYSELKNALLSYKGTKSRISWTADSFHNGRTQIAKINVKTNILELYLALEPESLEGTVYRGRNVGSKKKYAETPFQYKLRTPRKFKWAMELVQRTCEEQGLSPIDIEKIDYVQQYPFESTESLVDRKLIKEYIREEKPATTFELDPDHVPEVPEEDGSVIPANANFFWELDNDALANQEEEPEEIVEEVVEALSEEPVEVLAEEAEMSEAVSASTEPVSTANVVKETVKVTEMRYTERYFANAEPTYERIVTTHEAVASEGEEALTEETVYEEVAPLEETEPVTEAFYEEESEPVTESLYEEESEPATVLLYEEEESLPEEPLAEEEYFFDGEQSAEEIAYEEVYEEEPVEEEVYEEIYEEEPAEEEAVVAQKVARDAVPTRQIPLDTGVALIDICSVAKAFRDGETVNLETLKAKGLVVPTAQKLKIYAGGSLDKRLSVEAHHFSLEAIFAIGTAGGETSMLY